MTTAEEGQGGPGSGDRLLENLEELLFRQVHPEWIVDGVPSSQAFKPTPKDKGELSIALGSLTTADGAYAHHTNDLGFKSAGAWAVSVGEADAIDLRSFARPLDQSPAHGFIDFRKLGRGPSEAKGKVLLAKACTRGCLHPSAD